MRSCIIAAILMTPVLSGLGIAHASPVTYTGQFTASGALGGTTFTDALVTITEFADTSNIGLQSLGTPGIFANIANEATVTIAGISGTATFLDPLGITAATAANTIGVTPSLLMTDLAPLIDSAIFSLRPASPVPTEATLSTDGTTTGPAASVGATFDMYATDHGGLSFLPSTPTGQIVVTAVPEPGSLVLEGIGLGVVSLAALRRRRAYSACQ